MRLLALGLFSIAAAASACAQPTSVARTLTADPWCDETRRGWTDREVACEVREQVVQARALDVAAHVNGAVTVKEWDRDDVLVRARVSAAAPTQAEAERLVRRTSVASAGGHIRAETPRTRGRRAYAGVAFEIFAPRHLSLRASVVNGPLTVHGLRGRIEAETANGPVTLDGVGGDVSVDAANGPVSITLGSRWAGRALRVGAANGPVTLDVPRGLSARVEAETANGRIRAQGLDVSQLDRQRGRYVGETLTATLGRGGPLLSLETANGPITLRARG